MEIYWNQNVIDIICENIIIAYIVEAEDYALLTPIKTGKKIQPLMEYEQIVDELNKQQNLQLQVYQKYCTIILSPVGALFDNYNIHKVINGEYIPENKMLYSNFFDAFRKKIRTLVDDVGDDVIDRNTAIRLLWKYFCDGEGIAKKHTLIYDELRIINRIMTAFFDSMVMKVSNHLYIWEKAYGRKAVNKMMKNELSDNCLEIKYPNEPPKSLNVMACDNVFREIAQETNIISEEDACGIEESILAKCNISGYQQYRTNKMPLFYKYHYINAEWNTKKNTNKGTKGKDRQKVYSICELFKIYTMILNKYEPIKVKKKIFNYKINHSVDIDYQMMNKSLEVSHIAVELVVLNVYSLNKIIFYTMDEKGQKENEVIPINWHKVADSLHFSVLPYTFIFLCQYPDDTIDQFKMKYENDDIKKEINNYCNKMVYEKLFDNIDDDNEYYKVVRIPSVLGGRYLCASKNYSNEKTYSVISKNKVSDRADGISKKYWQERLAFLDYSLIDKNVMSVKDSIRINAYADFFKTQNCTIMEYVYKNLDIQ